jgi:hypothetical protein
LSFLLTEGEKQIRIWLLIYGRSNNQPIAKKRKQNKTAQDKNHHSVYIENNNQEKSFPQDFPTKIKPMLDILIDNPFDSNFVTWVLIH